MTEEIIILMPYSVDVQNTRKLLRERNLEIPVYEAMMDAAKELAAVKIAQGTRTILCRGATCRLLRQTFDIPIIEIRYDFYDFIASCKQAEQLVSRAALVGFNENFHLPQLRQLVQFERFEMVVLEEHRMAPEAIRSLKQEGIQAIIGGHSVCRIAREQGLETVTMEISDRSILHAITDAMHVYHVELEKSRQLESISSILDQAQEGIVTVDKRGILLSANQSAQHLLGISSRIEQININAFLPGAMVRSILAGSPVFNEMLSLKGGNALMSGAPVQVGSLTTGAVLTFHAATEVERMEQELRKSSRSKGRVAKCRFENIVGKSEAITRAKQRALLYARVDSSALICGPTGTGKELFAQSIHNASPRSAHPFVAINCAALPESVLESELFGYVKGAFTGARSEGKAGIFEQAHTGTIFLDEISEISPAVQAKLLRVIQEREVVRIGDDKIIPIDVRIIASTNRDLLEEVSLHRFREDLYYRLCVLPLSIPPLCERGEDILLLARYFIELYAGQFNKAFSVMPDAFTPLLDQPWPGNVRQLQNIMECVSAICVDNVIDQALIKNVLETALPPVPPLPRETDRASEAPALLEQRRRPTDQEIRTALAMCGQNKSAAAKQLGIGYTTLWRRLKAIGLV